MPILTRQRLAALFLFGLMAWFSPLVTRPEQAQLWFGVPALHLYLFAVWVVLVGLAALLVCRHRD